jgi:hypothetical protein
MEEIDGIPVDLALLPEELRDLLPLIRKFAISDDSAREAQMELTSRDELEALASLAASQWNALGGSSMSTWRRPARLTRTRLC